jgi:hypothetical protein
VIGNLFRHKTLHSYSAESIDNPSVDGRMSQIRSSKKKWSEKIKPQWPSIYWPFQCY